LTLGSFARVPFPCPLRFAGIFPCPRRPIP
jgi:hypothetical protein